MFISGELGAFLVRFFFVVVFFHTCVNLVLFGALGAKFTKNHQIFVSW